MSRIASAQTSTPTRGLTWDNVLSWRMARQHLQRRRPATARLDVISDLGGLHAQVMSSAELTLLARVEDLSPGMVAEMLWQERTLVKTWGVRGTLHLLPSSEFALSTAAQAVATPRYHAGSWQKAFKISRDEMEAVLAAAPRVLHDRLLTREELAASLAAESGLPRLAERLNDSWGSVLKPLAFAGVLCFGPNDGRAVRFTSPGSWLGSSDAIAPDERSPSFSVDTCTPMVPRLARRFTAGSARSPRPRSNVACRASVTR
jgi:Winged helix DNA-binding domain